jgi:hypothetical protein
LKAMTIWPAWQHFEEASKGSIEVGKLADFVILSKDPTAVKPETLDRIKVTETIKEGASIYKLDAKTSALESGPAGQATFARLLRALQGDGPSHNHDGHGDACPSEAIFQLSVALAGQGNP